MKRTIIAATAAALLASVTFGMAAPEFRTSDHPRPTPQQMAEFAGAMSDARIAALHAGLRLNPEQEKLWPALEASLRELSQQRIDSRIERFEKRAERAKDGVRPGPGERPDVIARLRSRADGLTERGETLKKLVDAADPLYKSLDEAQQRRFGILFAQAQGKHLAFNGPGGHGWKHGPHGSGEGRGPRGPMPHGQPGSERL